MSFEYKPRRSDPPVDPERCKAEVGSSSGSSGWDYHQCPRRPWQDGWCKQHHPDTVKAREEKRVERENAKQERSVYGQLSRANEEIARLEARIAELENKAQKEDEHGRG